MKKKLIILLMPLLLLKDAVAHCPLCTAAAAAAAGGAVYLGVEKAVIALFIGAFAISTGLWMSRYIKKDYIRYQKHLIALAAFLLTVLPILPIISDLHPLLISLFGGYGTLLNRTYLIDVSMITSILGGSIMFVSPYISKRISDLRKKQIPFQGMILSIVMLIIVAGIIQLVMWL